MAKNKSLASQISLLTFNTLGTPFFAPMITKRYKAFSQVLNASGHDVLCFQEVVLYYHLRLLKKHLTNYPFVAYKKFFHGPKGGLAIFSKLPLEDVSYVSYQTLGAWNTYTQIVRNGILACKVVGQPIRILNTHLISDFEYKSSEANKFYGYVKKQVDEAIIAVKTFARSDDAVLICGDFNLTPKDPLYKLFIKGTQARDIFAKETIPTYLHDRYAWKYKSGSSVRIDYIFLVDKYDRITVKSIDYALQDKVQITPNTAVFPSDHIALLTNFSIRK